MHERPNLPFRGNGRSIKIVLLSIAALNAALLLGGAGSHFATADEVRCLPGGLAVWKTGSFALANDFPPFAKMAASLPALFMRTNFYVYDLRETGIAFGSSLREREEEFGAHFAYANSARYLSLVRRARGVNIVWWLLGAWSIARWANELHGVTAVVLALVLWGLGPNVLAAEHEATPVFASAVAFALAIDLLRRHLAAPSWSGALAGGLALGLAQLVDFTCLAVYALWPVMAIVHRRPRAVGAKSLEFAGQSASVLLLSVWILNLGYGFQGSGRPLGDYAFVGRSLGAGPHSGSPPAGGEATGNRFRGAWLGRVPVPFPSDYINGLDRRWHEREAADAQPASGGPSAVRLQNPLATLGAKVPLGVGIMVVWGLVLTVVGRPGGAGAGRRDEIDLWLPVAAVLTMTSPALGILSPAHAIVLMAPFGAVIASKLADYLRPGRWKVGWLVVALAFWAMGSGLASCLDPRAYLNEAAGGRDRVAARLRHGPFDGGPDLPALRDWLGTHPEARLNGLAVRDPIGPRLTGLRSPPPPANPGPAVAGGPDYTRRFGPYPGVYALDPSHLGQEKYQYFQRFEPIAKVGAAIFVYRIARDDANRVRRELGLAALDESGAGDASAEHGLIYRTFVDSRGTRSHYALFVPPEYRGDRPWPLVLFLHGYGDRGTEGRQYTAVGLPPALGALKDGFGFLVLCPQGESGTWEPAGDDARRAMELLAKVEKEYRVDAKRTYLTGLSSGGAGTWGLAARYPDRWAAIVPVASSGSPALAASIKHVPCWCFHNSHDAGSPVANPRAMVQALRAAGGTPRYTEFFGLNHNAWDRAYNLPDLYDWLLSHRLP